MGLFQERSLPACLKKDEEKQCCELLKEKNLDAINKLIEHNLRLVVFIARKFENTGIDLEDMVSAGSIGLIKAVTTFDPDKNIKLATYASRCIENEILMSMRRNKKTKCEVSLDEPLKTDWDGNELLLSDVLSDPNIVEDEFISKVDNVLIREYLDEFCNNRKKKLLKLRFGVDCESRTQKETADILGVSQSYVSRLEKKALKDMRECINKVEDIDSVESKNPDIKAPDSIIKYDNNKDYASEEDTTTLSDEVFKNTGEKVKFSVLDRINFFIDCVITKDMSIENISEKFHISSYLIADDLNAKLRQFDSKKWQEVKLKLEDLREIEERGNGNFIPIKRIPIIQKSSLSINWEIPLVQAPIAQTLTNEKGLSNASEQQIAKEFKVDQKVEKPKKEQIKKSKIKEVTPTSTSATIKENIQPIVIKAKDIIIPNEIDTKPTLKPIEVKDIVSRYASEKDTTPLSDEIFKSTGKKVEFSVLDRVESLADLVLSCGMSIKGISEKYHISVSIITDDLNIKLRQIDGQNGTKKWQEVNKKLEEIKEKEEKDRESFIPTRRIPIPQKSTISLDQRLQIIKPTQEQSSTRSENESKVPEISKVDDFKNIAQSTITPSITQETKASVVPIGDKSKENNIVKTPEVQPSTGSKESPIVSVTQVSDKVKEYPKQPLSINKKIIVQLIKSQYYNKPKEIAILLLGLGCANNERFEIERIASGLKVKASYVKDVIDEFCCYATEMLKPAIDMVSSIEKGKIYSSKE